MVTITLHCPHCQSEALVRNGHAPNGKQLYRCRACGRQSRKNPTPHVYPQTRREEILHAYARTQHSPGPHSYLWRLAYDRLKLDQKKQDGKPILTRTRNCPLCQLRMSVPQDEFAILEKSSSASAFVYHAAGPTSRSSHIHDPGTG